MDNVLIQYKGGGYDGCFWEWNYAAIINGKFHDVASTGANGCETREELKTAMDYFDSKKHKYAPDYYIYHIPEDLENFAEVCSAPHVQGVAKYLAGLDIFFEAECTVCRGKFPAHDFEELLFTNYKSMGGVVVAPTDFICWECYSTPSDAELDELAIEYAEDVWDILIEVFPELEEIDLPLDPYYKDLFWKLEYEASSSGDGWFEKENGNYVWYSLTAQQLVEGFLSENMPEFVKLFDGRREMPQDIVMRNAGYVELPGMQEV